MNLTDQANQLIEHFTLFAQSDLFHNFAFLIIMIYAGTPGILFLPNEVFTAPAYVFGMNPLLIIVAVGIGGFLGDSLLYFVAHHVHKKLKGTSQTKIKHWLHKYKQWIFILSPSAFFGLGDLIMIFAGVKHIPYRGIAMYLLIGNFLRGIWGMGLVVYGTHITEQLISP